MNLILLQGVWTVIEWWRAFKASPLFLVAACRAVIRLINPKFEYRNPKQIQNSNIQNSKQKPQTICFCRFCFGHLDFGHLNLLN
jgi:hypothetical protein